MEHEFRKLYNKIPIRLNFAEISLMLEIVSDALKADSENSAQFYILQELRSEKHSTTFKSLALHVFSCLRKIDVADSTATQARYLRDLISFREKLIIAVRAVARPERVLIDNNLRLEPSNVNSLDTAIIELYQNATGRSPDEIETKIWLNNFSNGMSFLDFFITMFSSEEGLRYTQNKTIPLIENISDGLFIQIAYEIILGTGAAASEIQLRQIALTTGLLNRTQLISQLFTSAHRFSVEQDNPVEQDGKSCTIMGTGLQVTAIDWKGQAQVFLNNPTKPHEDKRYLNRFHIKGEPRLLVSAIASMYCGGEFIEQFMDNIASQKGFDDWYELVIIDANSPENEFKTIKRYLASHKNINYIRCNHRLGIYDAWNVGARAARGIYLTNTNMDDLRRHDSLELQAATLESLPFVDIVYQDLYYTFDPRISFQEVAQFGLQTQLPVVTPHNMIQFNSPHNAPMWRKQLHEEIGYFDTQYTSAGDYEFWMRCIAAKKVFYKTNDPHVVYYQNPKGLSTRPGGRGVAEGMQVLKKYCRKIIDEDVVIPLDQFKSKLDPSGLSLLSPMEVDRYNLAQEALRNAARYFKYPMSQGNSQ